MAGAGEGAGRLGRADAGTGGGPGATSRLAASQVPKPSTAAAPAATSNQGRARARPDAARVTTLLDTAVSPRVRISGGPDHLASAMGTGCSRWARASASLLAAVLPRASSSSECRTAIDACRSLGALASAFRMIASSMGGRSGRKRDGGAGGLLMCMLMMA